MTVTWKGVFAGLIILIAYLYVSNEDYKDQLLMEKMKTEQRKVPCPPTNILGRPLENYFYAIGDDKPTLICQYKKGFK